MLWALAQGAVWDKGGSEMLGARVCSHARVHRDSTRIRSTVCFSGKKDKGLRLVVRGNDFTSSGTENELRWLVREVR